MKILKNPSGVSWNTIDWQVVERLVFKQQKKIYKASKAGNIKLVRQLQDLLCKSSYAKWVAIKQTTHYSKQNTVSLKKQNLENPSPFGCVSCPRGSLQEKLWTGKGGNELSSEEKMSLVPLLIFPVSSSSFKKVWIPKPKKRYKSFGQIEKPSPLSGPKEKVQHSVQPIISTILTRCMQTLLKLALEPEWEAKFEADVYGFRPGRNYHHALKAIRTSISKKPHYLISIQIDHIFDKLNHTLLLKKTGLTGKYRQTLQNWLKAGLFNQEMGLGSPTGLGVDTVLNQTAFSSPILSPLLMNIAFFGLRDCLEKNVVKLFEDKRLKNVNGFLEPETSKNEPSRSSLLTKPQSIIVIQYAGNFIVLHSAKKIILACKSKIPEFFSTVGLILNNNQLQLSHTFELKSEDTFQEGFRKTPGFEFLGFQIQQFKTQSKAKLFQTFPYEVRRSYSLRQNNGKLCLEDKDKAAAKEPREDSSTPVKPFFGRHFTPNGKEEAPQNFQTRIWPSQLLCNLHQKRLHKCILSNQGLKLSQELLINLLNPIIGEWGGYFGRSDAKTIKTLAKMDFLLYLKLKKWGLKKTGSTKTGLQKYWTTINHDSNKRFFANSTKSVILKAHRDYSNVFSGSLHSPFKKRAIRNKYSITSNL
uniref:Putative reverse transcriptase and intron maturase n=1 Tax=Sarcinofilum mucosum TaxID=141643 RepID=A0A1W6EGD9_SARMC|nr:putative reverse transcriptase and intron maturase [Sarcinofilum mucosum]ARK14458.1 putative reverse transcriptase and intron maturase [Sarcinofilum mucosum]